MTQPHKFTSPSYTFTAFPRSLGRRLGPYLEPGNLATIAFVALAYFVVGKIGLRQPTANDSVTAIWLPAGIALAVLLLRGYRAWPGVYLGAFLLSIAITGSSLVCMAPCAWQYFDGALGDLSRQ